jgi:hypothetical protein
MEHTHLKEVALAFFNVQADNDRLRTAVASLLARVGDCIARLQAAEVSE